MVYPVYIYPNEQGRRPRLHPWPYLRTFFISLREKSSRDALLMRTWKTLTTFVVGVRMCSIRRAIMTTLFEDGGFSQLSQEWILPNPQNGQFQTFHRTVQVEKDVPVHWRYAISIEHRYAVDQVTYFGYVLGRELSKYLKNELKVRITASAAGTKLRHRTI